MRGAWIVLLLGVVGCDPAPVTPDGGSDAGMTDGGVDAGCSGVPGVLVGPRRVGAGAPLPDLSFASEAGEVRLTRFHAPCAAVGELVVIRSMAAWSGPSRWHVAHTGALADPRVHVLDLLTEDEDGVPAGIEDLAPFRARYDLPAEVVAIDPEDQFATLAFSAVGLPLVVIVESRNLEVVRVLFAPHAGDVEHAIAVALADLDGRPRPSLPLPTLTDERFPADAWDLIEGMAFAPPAPDPSNSVADDADAAALGLSFFEDAGLSPVGVSCNTCHDRVRGFTDGLPVGHGVTDVTRNTPTLIGAAHSRWPFWDGRTDSLWAQALGPIESAAEMGSSRLYVAHRVFDTQRRGYERTFGPMPELTDTVRFPPSGQPGEPSYDGMAAADRAAIDLIFANVGKAIASFERTIRAPETAFDRYITGELTALTPVERDGLLGFVENGCIQCHYGPTLSNDAFHGILMPGSTRGAMADRGRIDAFDALALSPFRRQGMFSDDRSAPDPLAGVSAFPDRMRGAFRTPPLRALARTGPYGHGGTFATLRDVVTHYATILTAPPVPDDRVVGDLDVHVGGFDPVETRIGPLTAFLETL